MFDDVIDLIEKDFDTLIHKTMNDAALSVVPNSPEDTGRFKGNWLVSIDRIGDDYDETHYDLGAGISTVGSAARDARKFSIKSNREVSLYNNVADEPNNHYAATVGYDFSTTKAKDLIELATSEALRTLDGK